ncbi:MAG TPA: hypothetical protein VK864_15305 [Longimicrobiales bacterium]|nr:hypothetical protein [Longimicrobiales bacterium]
MNRTKILLTALVGFGFASDVGLAQTSASDGANVVVSVVDGLTLLVDQDLSFGIAAIGSGVVSVAVTATSAARVRIYGQQNRVVFVTLTPPANLVSGSNAVPYSWAAAYNEAVNDPATATAFASTNASFRLRDLSPPGSAGQAFMWIYGSVNIGAVPPGTYTGTVAISVTY